MGSRVLQNDFSLVHSEQISGRKGSSCGRIRASCPMERMKLWKKHCERLLGQTPVVDGQPITRAFDALPIKTGGFTVKEWREAIQSTQRNKATGLDGIPAEVWKLKWLNDQLLEACNKASHRDIADIWLKGVILPFPWKRDLGSASNYRDITLIALGAKIYNRMLLNRLRPHYNPKLRNIQNCFRKDRCTVAQILTLCRLVLVLSIP